MLLRCQSPLAVDDRFEHASTMTGEREAASQQAPLVACIGNLMLDVRVSAPALADGGMVPGSVTLSPGGSAANVAVWARAAGAAARLVACRGDDLTGQLLEGALAAREVELHPNSPIAGTTGAVLVIWEAGERRFVADAGVSEALRTRHVTGGLSGVDALYISGYALIRPGSRRAAAAAARYGGRGLPAAVDASSWSLLTGAAKRAVVDAAALAGILLANADETAALTGLPDPVDAGAALTEQVQIVVVKLGAKGALVCLGPSLHFVDAEPVDVVDPTGAGDAFAAGFLVACCQGADPVEAARAGIEVAARAITIEGAWPPFPDATPTARGLTKERRR